MFWYASDDKLRTIVEEQSWLDRLKPSLGLSQLGAHVEVELEPRESSSVQRMVEKARRKIASEAGATSLASATTGPPPKLFAFKGAAGRSVDAGVFWVAGVEDQNAFLLAGSAANAIGTAVHDESRLFPTADPVGTIRHVFETLDPMEPERAAASYIWETIVAATADAGGLDAAPWVEGVAIYAGRPELQSAAVPPNPGSPRLLFIGSPLFVEQM
jgi:hypothetical protein